MIGHHPRIRLIAAYDQYGHAWDVSCPCLWTTRKRHASDAEDAATFHRMTYASERVPSCLVCKDRRELVMGSSPRNDRGGWDKLPCPRCYGVEAIANSRATPQGETT